MYCFRQAALHQCWFAQDSKNQACRGRMKDRATGTIQGGRTMGNRYERSRMSRSFTHKGIQYHPGVLAVLATQLLCLCVFAFAPDSFNHNKWLSAAIAFSLLFGLLLSLGFFGTWTQFRDDVGL